MLAHPPPHFHARSPEGCPLAYTVFAPLRDPRAFAQGAVDPDLGAVVWPNGADLDPDVLYAEVTGNPIDFRKPVPAD